MSLVETLSPQKLVANRWKAWTQPIEDEGTSHDVIENKGRVNLSDRVSHDVVETKAITPCYPTMLLKISDLLSVGVVGKRLAGSRLAGRAASKFNMFTACDD
jgi:hypothetical protein